MARPVIEVDVDDSKFQRFVELFQSYQEKLSEQPELWASVDKALGGATESLKDGATAGADALAIAAAQADLIGERLRSATKDQADFTRATRETDRGFQSLAKTGGRTAAGLGKAFSGAVRGSVAEMGSGIVGVAETAAAALGPVGLAAGAIAVAVGAGGAALKALADAAVTRQRSAFSLGLTPGQEASFGINAQQFLGPEALRAAASAQSNYGNAGALATLGIDFNKARNSSASDLAYQMLSGAVKAAKANPGLPLENIPAIMQYEALGGNLGDVRNALKMGLPALAAAQADTQRNAARFDLNRKAVAASAALKKSFESAGVAAQSGLINNVSGGDSAIARVLGAITGDKAAQASLGNAFHRLTSTVQQHVDPALGALRTNASKAAGALGSVWHSLNTPIAGTAAAATLIAHRRGLYPSSAAGSAAQTVVDVARRKGVDPKLALATALQESNLNPDLWYMDHYKDGSPAGYSGGLFSLLTNGGEGAGMTRAQILDPRTNANVALTEIARVARLHPDWSPGHIAAAAERPADPVGYAKMVDAFYQAILRAQRQSQTAKPPVKVHVSSSTSARVAVSVNAAAAH